MWQKVPRFLEPQILAQEKTESQGDRAIGTHGMGWLPAPGGLRIGPGGDGWNERRPRGYIEQLFWVDLITPSKQEA